MNINMKVTKKKKGKEGGFHLALASLHTNIIKLCLSNFIVIFSQFFHTHCRVPLFVEDQELEMLTALPEIYNNYVCVL